MQLYIYKTNIRKIVDWGIIKGVFINYKAIKRWSLDEEDIDRVLKIESDAEIPEFEIIYSLEQSGIYLEELKY